MPHDEDRACLEISLNDSIEPDEVLALYRANGWSAAGKPTELIAALRGSHSLVTARIARQLVGLGNGISDGHLVAYFPHLLVLPALHGQVIGSKIMQALLARYAGFHQLMLVADGKAAGFYRALGFERAGKTEPMWIYAGTEH